MKRLNLFHLFWFLPLMLFACAQLGVPAADTFNKKALVAYSTVEGVAKTAASLRAAGKLSDSDRENVLTTGRAAVTGIELAKQMRPADPQAAEDKLTATITVLSALSAYLASKEK